MKPFDITSFREKFVVNYKSAGIDMVKIKEHSLGDIEDFLAEFFDAGEEEGLKEALEILESVEYGYTNYMSQMSSKKNFEKGNTAKEVITDCREAIESKIKKQ